MLTIAKTKIDIKKLIAIIFSCLTSKYIQYLSPSNCFEIFPYNATSSNGSITNFDISKVIVHAVTYIQCSHGTPRLKQNNFVLFKFVCLILLTTPCSLFSFVQYFLFNSSLQYFSMLIIS